MHIHDELLHVGRSGQLSCPSAGKVESSPISDDRNNVGYS